MHDRQAITYLSNLNLMKAKAGKNTIFFFVSIIIKTKFVCDDAKNVTICYTAIESQKRAWILIISFRS